ncbi:DHH family phosphoesterase [Salipaludibacillus agaradhaerens]|jgi:single-stranded-DNA-specific exonuclease|uniref:DHH family phosphoesterase n=1 Tax=Salipaludibacillus agaradhaerens TaxID=76935 RepID=UPI0021508256|nr:DHH family phosphoesterase [Salipaludibacillus agaradhaerens]MCR6108618.1 DHH family phosphoesterase [Salipaludibacillus agaradhaerens]MCR6120646.1 DHH family phosphoesterase [Salipaludibacillus agaradhaerens]
MTATEQYIAPTQNLIIRSFLDRRELTQQDVMYLMNPEENHQHDPFLLKGVGRWIDCLHSVKGLPIAIIPDYDADGVLSGTLARVGLSLFGFGDAYLYPPKTHDGYGMSKTSVDNVLTARPDTRVIVTTDNGSNAHEGIQYAKERGLIVLVTDHHLAGPAPCADAVVNPNGHGDNTYPFTQISGTAVIYKVLTAYAHKYVVDAHVLEHFHSLVLLVGISTISDVMPLLNENRYYVTDSVRMLQYFIDGHSDERIMAYTDTPLHQYYRGVDLLVRTLNSHGKLKYGVNADTFGFLIGPMLNSPRRMVGDSELAFRLFQSKRCDLDTAHALPSDELIAVNDQRKAYVQKLTSALFLYINEKGDDPIDHMVFNARMRGGVAGLLSGNFTKTYGLPSIAFGVDLETSHSDDIINVDVTGTHLLTGSARSPETFDLHGFLSAIDADYPELIEKWGGHAQAAGIAVKPSNYERFKEVFTSRCIAIMNEQVAGHEGSSIASPFDGEYVLTTEAYDRLVEAGASHESDVVPLHGQASVFTNHTLWEAVRFFEQLAPFGHGFPKPLFSTAIAMREVSRVFYMGAEKQHVKLMLSNGLTVIHWNGAGLFNQPELVPDGRIFIVTGELGINEYAGNESLQLIASSICEVDSV